MLKQFTAILEQQYKLYYDWGCYTKKDIANFVKMGAIDGAAYKRITGEDYEGRSTEAQTEG